MYIHEFTVTGAGSFPLDMLRYDACYPANSEAVDSMGPARMGEPLRREVRLQSASSRKGWYPTDARWRSFGWTVRYLGVRKGC